MSLAPMSVSGLISGLDTATLIQQLMYLERQPIRNLESRITLAELQREAYQGVNTKLLTLKTAAEALSSAETSETRTATSSAPDAITATAAADAAEGSYTFRVMQLAQTSQVTSNDYADADTTPIGAGTIDIDIDGVNVGTVNVSATDTLQDVADAINALDIDAVASILDDGSGPNRYRLLVTSKVSGAEGQLDLTENIGGFSLSDVTVGQDAEVELGTTNPLTITSSTNTFANVAPGLTISVGRVTDPGAGWPFSRPTEYVTVTVGPSVSSTDMVQRVQAFVGAYNAAMEQIEGLYLYDSENEEQALLQGDTTLRFIRSDLSEFIVDPVAGLPDELNMLFQIGVTLDGEGALSLDTDVLEAKLAEDPQGVQALFADAADGISTRFGDRLDYITKETDGQIANAVDALNTRISDFEAQVERLDELLDMREERLRAEFMAMEQALAALQTQSAFFLTQFALMGNTSNDGGTMGMLLGS